jgi:hypothetical protein
MRRSAAHRAAPGPHPLSDGSLPGLIDLGAEGMAAATRRIARQLDTCRDAAGLARLTDELEALAERVEASTRLLALRDALPCHAAPAIDQAGHHALDALDRAGRQAEAVADDAWALLQAPARRRA